MRLQRGVEIAGIDPGTARKIVRCCKHDWCSLANVSFRLNLKESEVRKLLIRLTDAGYTTQRRSPIPRVGNEWKTTITGNALAMASFLRPIPRARAEKLLREFLSRVQEYNDDPSKPYLIDKAIIFGSYLDAEASELGDLDLNITYSDRVEGWSASDGNLDYAAASGRTFNTFIDELFWSRKELIQILKKRSGYLNIATQYDEDVAKLTDKWEVIYEREVS